MNASTVSTPPSVTAVVPGSLAARVLLKLSRLSGTLAGSAATLNDIHSCEDGSIGIADFIGFKEGEDDDDV